MNNIIIIVSIITNVFSIIFLIYLYNNLKKQKNSFTQFFSNFSDANIEQLIKENFNDTKNNQLEIDEINKKINLISEKSKNHLNKIGFKRYNPFETTGGDQSFILVLLDDLKNGIIISSLHQREVTRIFAKNINQGSCDNKLSPDEQEILDQTIK